MMYTTLHPKRPAFSMLTAIVVMVLMATVAALVMRLAGKTVQETTTQYRKEQAILLAKSYTEFAIMAATATNCVAPTIKGSALAKAKKVRAGQGYFIETHVRYVSSNSKCGDIRTMVNDEAMTYPDSIGAIIQIDVFVSYRNPDSTDAINNEDWGLKNRGITYHRRTMARL